MRDGVSRILAQVDQCLRSARLAAEREEFRISLGLVEYTNLPFVPPALMRLQSLYPTLTVDRHEMHGLQQVDALGRGAIDVGLGVPLGPLAPDAGVRSERLLTAGWHLLMRPEHRLAGLARLRIEDLAGERIVIFARAVNPALYDDVVRQCRGFGFIPNFVYETTQSQVGFSLVEQGLGVMLGAEYVFGMMPSSLSCRPIDGLAGLEVHLFSRAYEGNALVLDFMEIVTEGARRVALKRGSPAGSAPDDPPAPG